MDYEKEYKDLLEEVEQVEDTKRYPDFRLLRPDEIDIRVGRVTAKQIHLLLFKDARCDMNVLDDTVGKMNWKRTHLRDNKNCIVEIWDDKKNHWVSKEDTGTESNTEKEKGLASDSFKRSCFNWGIGRELYTAKGLLFFGDTGEIKENGMSKGKYPKMTYKIDAWKKFHVKEIQYNEHRVIIGIAIADEKNKVRFSTIKAIKIEKEIVAESTEEYPTVLYQGVEVQGISLQQIMFIKEYFKGNETRYNQVLSFYEVTDVTGLPLTLANEIIEKIKLEKEGK